MAYAITRVLATSLHVLCSGAGNWGSGARGYVALQPPAWNLSFTCLRGTLYCVEVLVETQNITLSIPKGTLHRVKLIAVAGRPLFPAC
jgi:hypothetical protein